MPRLTVIIAGLCIAIAALYGGWRGYEFTDLDRGAAAPATLPDTVVQAGAAEPVPAAPLMDERAVRELARAEVRQLIPPARSRPRTAPAEAAEPTVLSAPESPSTEAVEPETETEPAA